MPSKQRSTQALSLHTVPASEVRVGDIFVDEDIDGSRLLGWGREVTAVKVIQHDGRDYVDVKLGQGCGWLTTPGRHIMVLR